MGLGLAVRRLSLPLCVLAGVVMAAWSVLHEVTGGSGDIPTLIPLHAGARVALAGGILAGLLTVAALVLALRLLAITIGAVGWLVLPTEHRALLSRIGAPVSQLRIGESRDTIAPCPIACSSRTPKKPTR